MRLTNLDMEEWKQSAPYVDSLLVPVYGIRLPGKQPELFGPRLTERVAKAVEQELTGRLLLMPAIPYQGLDDKVFFSYIDSVVRELAPYGFHHLFFLGEGKLFPRGLEEAGYRWINLEPEKRGLEEETESVIQLIVRVWETESGE
ncbi:DUF2487 family protein [Salinithrix halophila]|uniref:DUF2487 family protein n=1 Tax=Salinithrix halophila TaxID=1485204 RepID=A0ABV8JMS7_9BACL